jgi:amino acid permease
MAYRRMPQRWKIGLSLAIILINFAIVSSRFSIGIFINMIGATTMPMMIYVFPGYLYYKYYQSTLTDDKSSRDRHGPLAKWFAMFGLSLVLFYSSCYLYTSSTTFNI